MDFQKDMVLWILVAHLQLAHLGEPVVSSDGTYVRMKGNDLDFLSSEAFCNNSHVDELHLTQCNLESIHPETFICLRNLRYLDITSCKMKHLPSGIFRYLHVLQELQIQGQYHH